MEEWRPVPGFEGFYEISSEGRVRSTRREGTRGGLISGSMSPDGYRTLTLHAGKLRRATYVHRLVAVAFLGPRPEGHDVRHLDGNPLNNRVSNLAYGTRSENLYDAVRHGTHHWAKKTHCPKGHPYDDENTRYGVLPSGAPRRFCKACNRAASSAYHKRRRAEERAKKANR